MQLHVIIPCIHEKGSQDTFSYHKSLCNSKKAEAPL